jgi:hypothetical protein
LLSRAFAETALRSQVLGQCKGVISAIVSVLCFRNIVPVWGWVGYGVTVVGCFAYGRCKAKFKAVRPAATDAAAKKEEDASEDRAHVTQQWLAQVREKHGPFPAANHNVGESERLASRACSDAALLDEQSRARTLAYAHKHEPGRFGLAPAGEPVLAEPESLAALSDGSEQSAGEEEVRERYMRARHLGHDRQRVPADPQLRPASLYAAKGTEAPHLRETAPLLGGKQLATGSVAGLGSVRSLIGVPTPGQRSRDASHASHLGSPSASPDDRSSMSSAGLRMSVLRPAGDTRLVHAS